MTQETKRLVPKAKFDDEKMETLDNETGNFKTWIRTSKDGSQFLVNGEPIGSNELVGVIVDFVPNWTRWSDGSEKPEKKYQEIEPDGEDWKRRCDLTMMTAQHGLVVLDLPFSGYRNFGKFTRDVKIYGKALNEVFAKAIIGKGRSKKFGEFNTIRFEIAGLIGGDSIPKAKALPQGDDVPFTVENETPAQQTDDDFLPY
jgi:hypothetical protein